MVRRIRKFKFKRNFKRRRFGRRNVRRRLLYRALRRRPLVPEIKWLVASSGSVLVTAGTTTSGNVTPATVSQGTAANQRVGANIKWRKVMVSVSFRSAAGETALTAPTQNCCNCRIIFWTPRALLVNALSYMSTIVFSVDQIDVNQVTVLKDHHFRVGHPYLLPTVGQPVLAAGGPGSRCFRKWVFKFPRNVCFSSGSDLVDTTKDTLYYSILCDTEAIYFGMNAKTTYTDA